MIRNPIIRENVNMGKERQKKNAVNSGHYVPPATPKLAWTNTTQRYPY